jgi:hypothetical protein
MRLETTLAIYGGFWSDAALDALDGTTKRILNKTYFFNKKEGHMMVNFSVYPMYPASYIGKYLDFDLDVTIDIDQTTLLRVNKFKSASVVNVCAEKDAIALREVL